MTALSAFVLFFGILIVSIVGVDVLGNRPVFFLVGEVTPAVGFAVLLLGLALLAGTSALQDTQPRLTASTHDSKRLSACRAVRPAETRRRTAAHRHLTHRPTHSGARPSCGGGRAALGGVAQTMSTMPVRRPTRARP